MPRPLTLIEGTQPNLIPVLDQHRHLMIITLTFLVTQLPILINALMTTNPTSIQLRIILFYQEHRKDAIWAIANLNRSQNLLPSTVRFFWTLNQIILLLRFTSMAQLPYSLQSILCAGRLCMNVSTLMTERPICLGRPNYCQFTTALLFSFGSCAVAACV